MEFDFIVSKVLRGDKGDPGLSAYQVAVANGFVGTEKEWLESLKKCECDSRVKLSKGIIVHRSIKSTSVPGDQYFFRKFISFKNEGFDTNLGGFINYEFTSSEALNGSSIVLTIPPSGMEPYFEVLKQAPSINDAVKDIIIRLFEEGFIKNATTLTSHTASPNFEIQNGEIICVKKFQSIHSAMSVEDFLSTLGLGKFRHKYLLKRQRRKIVKGYAEPVKPKVLRKWNNVRHSFSAFWNAEYHRRGCKVFYLCPLARGKFKGIGKRYYIDRLLYDASPLDDYIREI